MKKLKTIKIALCAVFMALTSVPAVYAASNSTLTQTITAGVLSTDILDAVRAVLASPSVTMSSKAFSFDCQTGGNASSGTIGTNTERLYVSNPSAANNGWSLTIAATGGAASTWANGGATRKIDFNDATTGGCSDGVDTDTSSGQMTINPSVGTLTTDCASCTATGVTKGASASFAEGTLNSLTLLSAAAASDDVWRGYLTGASISQVIPGETPADAYTVNLTLTATAL